MLSKRSIRGDYTKQITISFIAILAIFSAILYSYLFFLTFGEIESKLKTQAQQILKSSLHYNKGQKFYIQDSNILDKNVLLVEFLDSNILKQKSIYFEKIKIGDKTHYALVTPYYDYSLKITSDITKESNFLKTLLSGVLLVDFFAFILILFFALAFSNILYKPIQNLSSTLSSLKEQDLELLKADKLPLEFHPLVASINSLLERIKDYFNGQKQLFIGIAHELKTPLAVMKTKCEVTLIKDREKEVYSNVLKENIKSINEINAIIKTLLDLGRQESAQFEKSSLVEVNKILQGVADNFIILSKKEKKHFSYKFKTPDLYIKIKPTLLTQIIQNFLQNALKFTPENKSVLLTSQLIEQDILRISVIDEGCGIDSTLDDIYAPFRRAGNKSGAGLGLFLAKSAATALGGSISLKNRQDKQGSIATFELKIAKLK
ncbi:MAG: HAMP domain-containing sensor histidine kinase [Helicobacter sp.]|nr:HAMP domain-containing sensor histidine kinase [Helicobacteraceae bacterium]MDY3112819.1 HAMP domain-containing sensor histidine kinase [Helicobacter sp.]